MFSLDQIFTRWVSKFSKVWCPLAQHELCYQQNYQGAKKSIIYNSAHPLHRAKETFTIGVYTVTLFRAKFIIILLAMVCVPRHLY